MLRMLIELSLKFGYVRPFPRKCIITSYVSSDVKSAEVLVMLHTFSTRTRYKLRLLNLSTVPHILRAGNNAQNKV